MKQIIVDVLDSGEVKIETKGFRGKECIEESRFLKDLLGEETARQLVPTYYTRNKIAIRKHLPLCG
jgi:TFIIF-interacting CTD phosphatase-like protein